MVVVVCWLPGSCSALTFMSPHNPGGPKTRGNGCQEYDRTFRRQAAIDNTIAWNTLVPSLQQGWG